MSYQPIFLLTICIVCIIMVAHLSIPDASAITIGNQTNHTSYAMEKYQLIGIQLSPTCLTLIKNHMPTSCPTYDKLKPLDNTNPLWEGKWVNDTYFHRELPRVKNHWLMNLHTIIVMVDPDPNFTILAKMIIIQSGNFTFINPDEIIGKNHTRNEYHDRFVSSCADATVAPNLGLIEDTLHYLESGCKLTAYHDKTTVKTGDRPFTYDNPFSSLHYKNEIANLKSHPMQNCIIKKCDTPNLYKKPNWGK